MVTIVEKFKEHSYNPKRNAQANLRGRSYFVSDDTLRFFNGRVLNSYHAAEGRLFVLVHSQKAGFDDYAREFDFRIFALDGQTIDDNYREEKYEKFKNGTAARKAARKALEQIDATHETDQAVQRVAHSQEFELRQITNHWPHCQRRGGE